MKLWAGGRIIEKGRQTQTGQVTPWGSLEGMREDALEEEDEKEWRLKGR